MTKKILGRIAVLILAVIVLAGSVLTVSAESSQYVPNESYTYWDDITGSGRKLVSNRAMFETDSVYDAKKLGVENFSALIDVCTDKNGYVYPSIDLLSKAKTQGLQRRGVRFGGCHGVL